MAERNPVTLSPKTSKGPFLVRNQAALAGARSPALGDRDGGPPRVQTQTPLQIIIKIAITTRWQHLDCRGHRINWGHTPFQSKAQGGARR